MMPMWQDRAFIQLPGLHPLVLARHNSLFFTFCSATRFPVYAWNEQCKDTDELVTLELARVQETSSIIDHGTHLPVNQMKEFTLFFLEPSKEI